LSLLGMMIGAAGRIADIGLASLSFTGVSLSGGERHPWRAGAICESHMSFVVMRRMRESHRSTPERGNP
jgi:hypothetical protein